MRPSEGSFLDVDAEGPFATAMGRDAADAYIREKIKDYEGLLCYYKRRLNALNPTCRIPPEILAKVFSEVAQCSNSGARGRHLDWIETVSHVCSHWREVALSTPTLWSNIPVAHSLWATEMIQRSKTMPLTINYEERSYSGQRGRSCKVLKEIFHSHCSRIKNLTLSLSSTHFSTLHNDTSRGRDSGGLPTSLDQPMPNIERLEVKLSPISEKNILPEGLLSISSRLQHLKLEGCAMIWNSDFIAFRNLRSLEISGLPEKMSPSVVQLLAVLSQTPLLENLLITKLQNSSDLGDTASPQNNVLLNLEHLERIAVASDLSTCAFLMDHITFSRNAQGITLRFKKIPESSFPLIQSLAQRIDNGIKGSIRKLKLDDKIRCWKLEDITTSSPQLLPTIAVGIFASYETRAPFFGSLRLEQLQSLEVNIILKKDEWSLLGALPHLTTLRVVSNERTLLVILLRGTANVTPGPDTPPLRPAFVALQSLTIVSWGLKIVANKKNVSIIQILERCLKRRKKTGQHLHLLRLEDCRGVDDDDLARLRKFSKRVDWVGFGNEFSDCTQRSTDEASYSAENTDFYHGSNH